MSADQYANPTSYTIPCPKRVPLKEDRMCGLESKYVRGKEAVHRCPTHGLFKVKFDGDIVWWHPAQKGRWLAR